MKYVLVFIAALVLSWPAVAQQGQIDKGPNGGQMQDVAGVDAELLTSGNTVTINIFDESAKPIAAKGFSAAVLIVSGSDRETLTLVQSGENALKAEAKKPIATGATITLTLKSTTGKSGQVRFKL